VKKWGPKKEGGKMYTSAPLQLSEEEKGEKMDFGL
jgi:hypothetical protein